MESHARPDVVWSARPGVAAELTDAGTDPAVPAVQALLADGHDLLVKLSAADSGGLAAAAVYAWLGVRAFVFPGDPAELRQVLDMVASIKGERPPAVGRRALA
ncbi:MAG: hypothetical protein ABIQ26_17500 [Streptosporangiaceae bacterium]